MGVFSLKTNSRFHWKIVVHTFHLYTNYPMWVFSLNTYIPVTKNLSSLLSICIYRRFVESFLTQWHILILAWKFVVTTFHLHTNYPMWAFSLNIFVFIENWYLYLSFRYQLSHVSIFSKDTYPLGCKCKYILSN